MWDICQKDYHSREKKEIAYNEIKDILDVGVGEIKSRLLSLRAQLGREIAKTNNKKSGQSESQNYKSAWLYWERLQFLRPVINAGRSEDNRPQKEGSNETECLNAHPFKEDAAMDSTSSSSSYKSPSTLRAQTEEKKREFISTCIEALKEPTARDDHQCSFSMYVAEKLKALDRRSRIIAEKRIAYIFFELEMSDINSGVPQLPSPIQPQLQVLASQSNARPQFSDDFGGLQAPFIRNSVQYSYGNN